MWENATFGMLVARLTELISVFILVIFALTFLVMLWKIIDAWIIHGGESTKVAEGKKTILFGFIVIVVMSSVWGIVALLRTVLPAVSP